MVQEFNVGFAFLGVASQRASEIAICDGTRQVSYGQLAVASVNTARHMRRLGVGRGSTVAVRSDDLVVVLATVFATALLGSRWLFATQPPGTLDRLHIDFTLDSEPDAEKRIPGSARIDETWALPPEVDGGRKALGFPGYGDPDDVWMISATSGTTGTPKLVGLSHRIVTSRNAANRRLFECPGTKVACTFPIGAPAALSRYISALVHKGQIVASVEPEVWIREEVDMVVGSPAQVRALLGDRKLPKKLPLIHLSGASISEKFVLHLLKSFEKVANGYGSTEAHNCLSVVRQLAPDGSIKSQTIMRNAEVQIVDEADTPLSLGDEGVVRIRNDRAVDRYLDNPEASAAVFRDGWFYPGDLGMWTEDGQFIVTGRINDQFNLGGVKLNAALLDFTLQNVPGIEDAVCFMMPRDGEERLTAFVKLAPGSESDVVIANAKVELMRVGGRDAVPRKFLFADELPRNRNGKADRRGCVAMVDAQKERRREQREGKTSFG